MSLPNTEDPASTRALAVVADDDGATRRVLTVLLEREGFRVRVAIDGQSALVLIRESRPAIVFLDARMPAPDGYDVCRSIRSEFPPEEQPHITMLTASGRDDDRALAAAAGVDEFLTKPFSPARLSARLHARHEGLATERAAREQSSSDG